MSEAIRIPGGFRQFAFVHGEPGCSAQIKQEFEDFQVDEELGFAPLGSGEHLLVRVCKQDMGTLQAAAGLARELGVSPAAVGYSGMKDRRAITTQWFSVPQKTGSRLRPGTDLGPGLRILEIHGNDRKLRIGSHRANRFRIRLRHLRDEGRELETRLMRIRAEGVPNYFGPQRLGREFSNVSQAQETFLAFDENKGRLRPARKKKVCCSRQPAVFCLMPFCHIA